MKHYFFIATLFLSMLITCQCTSKEYVPYKPHYVKKDMQRTRFYGSSKLDAKTFANTVQVLKYYGEDFKTKDNNTILILKSLAKNWEILWNYTSKANNQKWLASHKVE